MKKSIIILSALSMTIASFNTITPNDKIANADAAAERLAISVITAFQHASFQEYAALFPRVETFHKIMEKNSGLYGENLEAAKEEFEMQYTKEVLPALNQSFTAIITQGIEEGVSWSTIKLVNVEFNEQSPETPLNITFSSDGKEYHLKFERTLHFNGEWKISQYVKLS